MPKKQIDLEKEWKNLREKLEDKNEEGELEEEVEEAEEEIDSMNFANFVEQTPVIEERTVLLDKVEELPAQEQPNLEDNIESFTETPKEEFDAPQGGVINEPKYIANETNYNIPAGFEFETSRAGIKIEAPVNMMRRDFLNPMSSRGGLMPQGGGYPEIRMTEEAEDNKKYFEKE